MISDQVNRSPSLHPVDSKRKMSLTLAMEIDLYDKVLYFAPQAMTWNPAVILGVNSNGTYEIQTSPEGTVINHVPHSSIRRVGEPGDDLMKQRQLGASFAVEVNDEDCFQLETALFFSKVLKTLEASDDHKSSGMQSPSMIRRSMAMSLRSRISSSMTNSGSLPLLDHLMNDTSFPTTAHVMRIVDAIRERHVGCPTGFTGIVANSGGMGTCCVDSDWCITFASSTAITRLLEKMLEMLHVLSPQPLTSATVPPGGRFVLVGDTHGQIEDVFWIFFKHGFPSSTNVYLFNGDVADRGSHSVEIFILIFLFKWLNPDSIHLLRGNHEDDYCNLNYGFCAELRHKLGQFDAGSVHQHFLEVFYALPIAAVVDSWPGGYKSKHSGVVFDLKITGKGEKVSISSKSQPNFTLPGNFRPNGVLEVAQLGEAKRSINSEGAGVLKWSNGDVWEALAPRVLVLHGGIPVMSEGGSPFNSNDNQHPAVSLSDFKFFPNRQKIPPAPKSQMEQLMYQVLWSDPREAGEQRGRGTPFFPADTDAFLAKNNLALVIRSHQLPPNQRGVGFNHRKKLITIFSASNYCGTSQNFGAVVLFTPQTFPAVTAGTTAIEFWAPTLAQVKNAFTRHGTAPDDVRKWFAQEVEKAAAPLQVSNDSQWLQLQLKVVEYVRTLIVKHKVELCDAFLRKDLSRTFVVPLRTWVDVCAEVVGSQFPWRTLAIQLEVPEVYEEEVDYLVFLDSFEATANALRYWSSGMVTGFFEELFISDIELQNSLMLRDSTIDYRTFLNVMQTNCPGIFENQIRIFWSAIFLSGDQKNRLSGRVSGESFAVACSAGFSPNLEIGSAISQLKDAAVANAGSLFSFFFRLLEIKAGFLPVTDFAALLKDNESLLGLGEDFPFFAVASFIGGSTGRVSFLKFCAARSRGEGARRAGAAISEHACAAYYFHRTALRIACNYVDTKKTGEISRRDLRRVLAAVNGAVSNEWKLVDSQILAALNELPWKNNFDETTEEVEVRQDNDSWINYEGFISAFEIIDRRKMSRASSFGWHLVKDALGTNLLPIK